MSAWEALVRILRVHPVILPPPVEIAIALWQGLSSGLYLRHIAVTLQEVLLGFIFGSLIAVAMGVLIARFTAVERVLAPYLLALQTMPKVAIAPLLMIWVGFGIASKVIITAIVAGFPVLVNAIVGLRAADQDQVEMLRAFGAPEWRVFRLVRLPAALPYLFAGISTAAVLSVLAAVTGEFVGAYAGLGYLLNQQMYRIDTAGVFSVLTVLTALGLGMYFLAESARRRVVFWIDRGQPPSL